MTIAETVERYIIDELMIADRGSKLAADQSLLESGILDSLALLRLVGFLEERYKFKLQDYEIVPDNFDTLNDIVALVESKQG